MEKPRIFNMDAPRIADVYGISPKRREYLIKLMDDVAHSQAQRSGGGYKHSRVIDEVWDYCNTTEEQLFIVFCEGSKAGYSDAVAHDTNLHIPLNQTVNPN